MASTMKRSTLPPARLGASKFITHKTTKKKAQSTMKILIYVPGLSFNGSWLEKGLSLGGSESAGLFMAEALADLGHAVTVFTTCREELTCNGVSYRYAGAKFEDAPLGDRWHAAALHEHDVCIVQRVPVPFTGRERARLCIWWLHDLALLRQCPLVNLSLPFVDRIFCVSEFHRQQVAKIWEIDPTYIVATHNGVDYDLVRNIISDVKDRNAKQLVFASRPERGLEELLQPGGIMDQLPDYTLHVCTYANPIMVHADVLHSPLQTLMQRLPNVVDHGSLGKNELYRLLAQSQAYVYPTTFEDTSNIMLLEANACGTPFIAPQNLAALPETGKDGALVEVPWNGSKIDATAFASTIRHICENDETWQALHVKAETKCQSWAGAALQWHQIFARLLVQQNEVQRPDRRQSLTLCMLVKDAADTLPLALKSAAYLCDDIVIGVDETTTDDTVSIARKLHAKIVPLPSPLQTGFDTARNTILEHVTTDWVLWLDSDEIMDKAYNLAKYLKDSPVEAFAVPQHHLATEPLGLLKTDLPARLFRNRHGFQYFGMVHEHPEKGLNGGLGRAVQLHDVGIIHQGYLNEDIRRERFARNWPLLQADRRKYPERNLGQMLWLRDLAHMLRFRLERGENPDGIAREILQFWEDFAAQAPARLLLEALPYYSEAVCFLYGANAMEIKLSLTAECSHVANKTAQNVHGLFPDTASAEKFMTQIMRQSLIDFDAKYF